MKTGNRLKKWKILAAGFVFMTTASAATAPVAAGSLLSVTGESQFHSQYYPTFSATLTSE